MSTRGTNGIPAVAITGVGMITALGLGQQDNWRRATAGESGIHSITRFPTEGLKTTVCASVDYLNVSPLHAPSLSLALARAACDEALAQSAAGRPGSFPGPMFLAAPPLEIEWPQRFRAAQAAHASHYAEILPALGPGYADIHTDFLNGTLGDRLADIYGTQGAPITLTTACSSGATAIQLGVEAIRRGSCDVALAIGTDGSMHPEALIRFALLSALSTANEPPQKAAKPFAKNRDGFVLGEGAGALVLENADAARARGAHILAYVRGCGEAADTFHRTRSSPDGSPIVRSMTNAMADAGMTPDDIDYINAHGTGTSENDKMEYAGISRVFGARAGVLPVSSNKSMVGHTLTAAGAVEAAFSVLTLRHGMLPPTINYEIPDPAIPLDVVPNRARAASPKAILSNSFGFGGQNVSLVFGLEPH